MFHLHLVSYSIFYECLNEIYYIFPADSFARFNSELALKNELQRRAEQQPQSQLNSPADASSVLIGPQYSDSSRQEQQQQPKGKPPLGQTPTGGAETTESGGKSTVRDPLHSHRPPVPHLNAAKRRQQPHRRRFSVPETIMRR